MLQWILLKEVKQIHPTKEENKPTKEKTGGYYGYVSYESAV